MTTTRRPDTAYRRVRGDGVHAVAREAAGAYRPSPAAGDAAGSGMSPAVGDAAGSEMPPVVGDPAASEMSPAEEPPAEALGEVLAWLDVDSGALVAIDEQALRDRMQVLNQLEGAVSVAVASTVKALAEAGAPKGDGASSVSAWLQENSGRSTREAATVARRAGTLERLPSTKKALAQGRISSEAADAIVRASDDASLGTPDEVDRELATLATRMRPEQLRAEIRRRQQAASGDAMLQDENAQRARRRLSLTRRQDGMWDLYGLLPTEMGDRARTLLDVFDLPDPKDTPEGQKRTPQQRMADAFDSAVGVALDHAELPASGGVTRPHVQVMVDVHTLDADLTDPATAGTGAGPGPGSGSRGGSGAGAGSGSGAGSGRGIDDGERPVRPDDPVWATLGTAQLGWGGALSPQAARRICCDAAISRIVTAGASQVLDVGRATRAWSSAQRRAINVRDRACRGPGCDRPIAWTQIHHLRWWRKGGTTDVNNGLALCSHCHHLVHDVGWHVTLDVTTAAATWISPDRQRTITTHPRQPA